MPKLMPKLAPPSRDLADVQTIGIPRALLYYRYGTLWTAFFEGIGKSVVVSPATDRVIVESGENASVDECCLASKAYVGHCLNLIGRCDALFVPSYASGNSREGFCTKFQSAPDLVANALRDENVRIASFLVEDATDAKKTRAAFVNFGLRLGASASEAHNAWKEASRAQKAEENRLARAQEALLRDVAHQHKATAAAAASAPTENTGAATDDTPANAHADATTDARAPAHKPVILLVAHSYIAHDAYLAGSVIEALNDAGATVLFADQTDHARACKASYSFSETLPWITNRELIGSILQNQDELDGIVLVSAFPCGPDSMTDDAIMRCIQGTPILNLMIDAQSGTAGVQTRVESFMDILQFHQKGGYLHDR